MAPKPRSRRDRDPAAALQTRGVTSVALGMIAEDQTTHLKTISSLTERNHSGTLRVVINYLRSLDPSKLATFPGGPLTSPEDVLRPNTIFTQSHLHALLYFKAQTSFGQLGERMTIYSLQIFLFTFRSAYKRKTGYTIPAPAIESGLAYITGELARQLDLKAAKREKAIPDGDAMFGLASATLSPKWQPQSSRQRVQLLLYYALAIVSGSRVGAITLTDGMSGQPGYKQRCLCYGHCTLVLIRDPDGGPNQLVVKFRLEHTKTKAGKDRDYYLLPRQQQAMSGPLLWVYLALKDGALAGNPTVEQLLDPAALGDKDMREISIKPELRDTAVLRSHTSKTGTQISPDVPICGQRIREDLKRVCAVANYPTHFVPHAFRSMVVIAGVHAGKSLEEIKLLIGHEFKSSVIKTYMSNASHIDTANLILGGEERRETLLKLDSSRLQPDAKLPKSLSPRYRNKIFEDQEYKELQEQQETLAQKIGSRYITVTRAPADLQSQYTKLYRDGYNTFRRLYKYWYAVEIDEYREQAGTINGTSAGTVDISGAVDLMPEDGSSVFSSLSIVAECLGNADLSIVSLLKDASEDEVAFYLGDQAEVDASDTGNSAITTTSPSPSIAETSDVSTDPKNFLKGLAVQLFNPQATTLECYRALAECPDYTKSDTIYWPGLAPCGDLCPFCDVQLETLLKPKSSAKKHTGTERQAIFSSHIRKCGAKAASEEAYSELAAKYQWLNACPFCPIVDTSLEAASSATIVAPAPPQRNPVALCDHVVRNHTGEEISCSCGEFISAEVSLAYLKAHLLLKHTVYLYTSSKKRNAVRAMTNWSPGVFDEAQYSMTARGFIADPEDFERACEADLRERFEQPPAAESNHAALTYGAGPRSKPCDFGLCPMCVHSPSEPFSVRMYNFATSANLKSHVLRHVLDAAVVDGFDLREYASSKELRHVTSKRASSSAPGSVALLPPSPIRHCCPDPRCQQAGVPAFALNDLCNHLIETHGVMLRTGRSGKKQSMSEAGSSGLLLFDSMAELYSQLVDLVDGKSTVVTTPSSGNEMRTDLKKEAANAEAYPSTSLRTTSAPASKLLDKAVPEDDVADDNGNGSKRSSTAKRRAGWSNGNLRVKSAKTGPPTSVNNKKRQKRVVGVTTSDTKKGSDKTKAQSTQKGAKRPPKSTCVISRKGKERAIESSDEDIGEDNSEATDKEYDDDKETDEEMMKG